MLDELEQLEKAATPGQWVSRVLGLGRFIVTANSADVIASTQTHPFQPNEDADFALIAAARNALPTLLRLARAAVRYQEVMDSPAVEPAEVTKAQNVFRAALEAVKQ